LTLFLPAPFFFLPIFSLSPDRTAPILVSNHISYLDPFFFFVDVLPLSVAKKEVGATPLIGQAMAAISILVDREDVHSKVCSKIA
jgi:1-acyl-sn-glycerol-3-phosphate acyltransferase